MKEQSPFTPGKPVPVEYFVGRSKEIDKLIRATRQVCGGRNENVFLTGERGIGKSSLAGYIRYLVENDNPFLRKEEKLIGVYSFLGPLKSLSEICRVILQRVTERVSQVSPPDVFEKAKNIVGRYIERIQAGLFGVGFSVEFKRDQDLLNELPVNFISILRNLFGIVAEEANRKGILLILDDLNGVSKIPEFSLFLKSMVDELATTPESSLPLFLFLVGVQDRMDDLTKHQPSIARIFNVVELSLMSREEASQFIKKTLDSVSVGVDKEALESLVSHCGGFPALLHEAGDAVYWEDTDNYIDMDDVRAGLFQAAENVGRKYLDRQVYKELHSRTYRSILRRIAHLTLGETIKRKEVLGKLIDEREKRNFDNFVEKMKQLGMMKSIGRGEYIFLNELFRLYVILRAFQERGKISTEDE